MAIAVIAIAAAASSAVAADRFALDARIGSAAVFTQAGSLPFCGHVFK
ncbi:hypothetical protein [Paraburkholderia fungorum]|nr:hypothetical protein [Paraburkholderia fungorum]